MLVLPCRVRQESDQTVAEIGRQAASDCRDQQGNGWRAMPDPSGCGLECKLSSVARQLRVTSSIFGSHCDDINIAVTLFTTSLEHVYYKPFSFT